MLTILMAAAATVELAAWVVVHMWPDWLLAHFVGAVALLAISVMNVVDDTSVGAAVASLIAALIAAAWLIMTEWWLQAKNAHKSTVDVKE